MNSLSKIDSLSPEHTILVMDDEDYIRNLSKKMLEKFGFAVELASDGKDAVSIYKAALKNGFPVSLVILDLTVPQGMGGAEASKRILEIDPNARIAISSGNSNDPLMRDYQSYGFAGALPKPYRLSEIKDAVENMIQQ